MSVLTATLILKGVEALKVLTELRTEYRMDSEELQELADRMETMSEDEKGLLLVQRSDDLQARKDELRNR